MRLPGRIQANKTATGPLFSYTLLQVTGTFIKKKKAMRGKKRFRMGNRWEILGINLLRSNFCSEVSIGVNVYEIISADFGISDIVYC